MVGSLQHAHGESWEPELASQTLARSGDSCQHWHCQLLAEGVCHVCQTCYWGMTPDCHGSSAHLAGKVSDQLYQ